MIDQDEEDDDELELPPLPSLDASDEEVGTDDFEPGMGLDLGDNESVGLDDSEGIDDFDPVAELLPIDEKVSAGDTEEAGDLVGQAEIRVEGDEYGWTEGSASPADGEWDDDDPLIDEPETLGAEDGGELGLVEEQRAFDDDDDASDLPPLRGALMDDEEEPLASDLDLQGDGEIAIGGLAFEQERRLMGAELPSVDASTSWDQLMQRPALALCATEGGWWSVGEELIYGGPDGIRTPPAGGLEAEDLVSVTALDAKRVVVGTRLGGVFRSKDGGRTFEAVNSWRSGGEPTVPCRVAFDRSTCLWMWAGGALYRSDDLGSRWVGPVLSAPVIAATIDGEAIVALCGSRGQLSLRRSVDGGRGWTSRDVPPMKAVDHRDVHYRVAAHGPAVAVIVEGGAEGPLVQVGEEPWAPVPGLLGVEAIAWWKAGSLCGAMHVASIDRGVVIEQRRYAGEPHTILDLAEVRSPGQDPEGDRRVHALAAAPDGSLLVATGVGVFRLTHDR